MFLLVLWPVLANWARGRVVGTLIYSQSVRSTGDNQGLWLTSEVGVGWAVLWDWTPTLWKLMLSESRQHQNSAELWDTQLVFKNCLLVVWRNSPKLEFTPEHPFALQLIDKTQHQCFQWYQPINLKSQRLLLFSAAKTQEKCPTWLNRHYTSNSQINSLLELKELSSSWSSFLKMLRIHTDHTKTRFNIVKVSWS